MTKKERTDPIEDAATSENDLYDVATWEERTSLDGLSVAIYRVLSGSARWGTILVAAVLLLGFGGFSAVTDPAIGALTALSAVPALALAVYVYRSDITTSEPLGLLVATFLLGVLTANFAAILNSVARPFFEPIGFLGTLAFFFIIVGPVEETVKLLAVRLYAYGHDSFDSVLDGAVYGAMAGLGFAFIENALYISRGVEQTGLDLGVGLIGVGGGITFTRALAGPGHVIYSAFAGYYLGLAKFNPENRGPIVIKGLIIAALIHATYNSTVGIGSAVLNSVVGLPSLASSFVYIALFDGVFALVLIRKIGAYRAAYRAAHGTDGDDGSDETTGDGVPEPELTEFDA
ncbi:PrsW family intramembrane metalloprotease [Halobaculum sp. CBA1158]|uniref:PrsW family intramembrane metalloprotease n=1 Tax=Halobaculum sp. CBA1158 TaxID=2904243 RepID=UPI001F212947|nr:PrsW family intramembrane metalloprotease [Halobaculum sp. CBA1158]UIP00636.1 PrsW family intramembrane metalloprotease [Halobaculum sp. CBA1158]